MSLIVLCFVDVHALSSALLRCSEVFSSGRSISYPDSSGSFARGWLLGETLGNWNFITAVDLQ